MAVVFEEIEKIYDAARTSFDFSGRTCLITGGAGILGRGFAAAILAAGGSVVIADIDEKLGREVEGALSGIGEGRAKFVQMDVASPESIENAFALGEQEFGPITAIIINHTAPMGDATKFFAPFESFELTEWRRQMSITLDGVFLSAQSAIKHFLKHKRPSSILLTSSIYGVMGHDKRIYEDSEYRGVSINTPPPYATAKAGVIGLMRWISAEYADQGIRANALAPGGVFSGENDKFTEQYGNRVPIGRMAHQTELFGAALYLLSGSASYVTGQVLMVDGGLSAW